MDKHWEEITAVVDKMIKIDYATYIPASMPKPILDIYLKTPVEKREEMLLLWLSKQENG